MKHLDLVRIIITFHEAIAILWTGALVKNSPNFLIRKSTRCGSGSPHLGAFVALKKGLSRTDWNGFVEIKSVTLLTYGWEAAIDHVFSQLKSLGFYTVEISINRVDYCIDFLNANLTLDPTCFVTHARVKRLFHYESNVHEAYVQKTAMAQSDYVKSVTQGKMPGRQVIIYDKRAEVIERRKL